jgi:hypothetical protein
MSSDENKVLEDHRREGTVFKPPMSQYGPFEETNWRTTTMPELIWLGLILDKYDLRSAIDLGLYIAATARDISNDDDVFCFAFMSSFDALDSAVCAKVRKELEREGKLSRVQSALAPLVYFYPKCPLKFLFEESVSDKSLADDSLSSFKAFLDELFDKRSRLSVLMQAQAVYIFGTSGRLHIVEDSKLQNIDELKNYPDTKESRAVGASICATCNMLVGQSLEKYDSGWDNYFWRRGLEIDECEYELPYQI